MEPLVTVTIVTYNSSRFIQRCLRAIQSQDYPRLEIIIVDNASTDGCRNLLAKTTGLERVIYNSTNVGFAAAQNQAIRAGRGDWVLALNPDVRLQPGFVSELVSASRADGRVGTVCGKLLRATPDLGVPAVPRIDSTGLYFTPNQRHFDRGWNEPDIGQFDQPEYVFGASAAAALYRREMIDEIAHDDGFFDPDFFAYREDADVAWRAQLMNWRCVYTPRAVGYHIRSVVPRGRWRTPALLRMHSVKNRFLMRVKNMTGDLYLRRCLPVTLRDIVVVGGCLLAEPGSLPAFWRAAKCLPRAVAKRRRIMSLRKASDESLAAWFGRQSPAQPLDLLPVATAKVTSDTANWGLSSLSPN